MMGVLLTDEADQYTAFATGQSIRAWAVGAVAAYRRAKQAKPTTQGSGLTQAEIDGREPDWAQNSDSFNARIARLP